MVYNEIFKRAGRVYAELREYRDGDVLIQEWVDVSEDGTRRGRANFRVADGVAKTPEAAAQVIQVWHFRATGPEAHSTVDLANAERFMRETRGWGVLHVQWPPHPPKAS